MTQTFHPLHYSVHTRLRRLRLEKLLRGAGSGAMLDIGCGTGYFLETLGDGRPALVGLEYDEAALRSNRARGLSKMARGSASRLPFRDGAFDVIICSELLEHLPDGADEAAIEEIARTLKPGGRAFITVPSLEGLRALSVLRNLGHTDPASGEYHHRPGYSWERIRGMIERVPRLEITRRRYSMFLLSELFMDLMKWVYFRTGGLKEQSDVMGVKDSPLFRLYRLVFPALWIVFAIEDAVAAPLFGGHILILELRRAR